MPDPRSGLSHGRSHYGRISVPAKDDEVAAYWLKVALVALVLISSIGWFFVAPPVNLHVTNAANMHLSAVRE